jgi:hypothetical protein
MAVMEKIIELVAVGFVNITSIATPTSRIQGSL